MKQLGLRPHSCVLGAWLLATTVAACSAAPRYAVITVEDPDETAVGASSLRYGSSLDELRSLDMRGRAFRLTFGLSHDADEERVVWVEAWNDERPLARGKTAVKFARGRTGAAVVTLKLPCSAAADCPDEVYCDGEPVCEERMCAEGPPPCVASFACVISTCVEEARACSITVDHTLCPPVEGADVYCNPSVGCAEAPPCLPENGDADCQDDSVCNGPERCVNFHCLAGVPPTLSDRDPICTLDGCDDTRTQMGLEAIFHVALAQYDGLPCALEGGGGEVCVSSKNGCVASSCGDGVRFGNEVCDEGPANSASWALDEHCAADCSGPAPHCGDGVVQSPEACDDDVRDDTGNGCDASCQTNGTCGDGVTQSLFEDCDDGLTDTDDCDGCKTDCTAGCICNSTQRCEDAHWCGPDAACAACTTKAHCGPECAPCGFAERCDDVSHTCEPCAQDDSCGPSCTACPAGGATPQCGGANVGCITSSCASQPDFTRCLVAQNTRTYGVCSAGVCVEPGSCGSSSCNAPGVHFPLPDSGARACYDDTRVITCAALPCGSGDAFCGQDAQYGWDTENAASERFVRRWLTTDAPVVDDAVTGLTWQGCSAGLTGALCQNGGSTMKTDWWGALAHCDQLEWGGERGWRLPDRFELQSLVDASATSPTIDALAFPRTSTGHYWSSSAGTIAVQDAWTVSFQNGTTQLTFDKDFLSNDVRCVRGGGPVTSPRYSRTTPVTDEPIVTDAVTGLIWQGCPAGQTTTSCSGTAALSNWRQALSYCEALTWAGTSDWRLPQVFELSSIVDDQRAAPSIDPVAFPSTGVGLFVTSSTIRNAPSYAYSVDFRDGAAVLYWKTVDGALVRCVRGP